jgi:hypothetical protein
VLNRTRQISRIHAAAKVRLLSKRGFALLIGYLDGNLTDHQLIGSMLEHRPITKGHLGSISYLQDSKDQARAIQNAWRRYGGGTE